MPIQVARSSKVPPIVIGASVGGIEVLKRILKDLGSDLTAAVMITLHISPWARSILPAIFTRNGSLPALDPVDGEEVEPGRVYVAPPDFHLVLDDSRIRLRHGPKENHHRPAINPLVRSAAISHGESVVGVVLSGTLDDGSVGLWWIKHYGGIAVVQDPKDATAPEMPANALKHVKADYILRSEVMGQKLRMIVKN